MCPLAASTGSSITLCGAALAYPDIVKKGCKVDSHMPQSDEFCTESRMCGVDQNNINTTFYQLVQYYNREFPRCVIIGNSPCGMQILICEENNAI